jgi:hypothetical protein
MVASARLPVVGGLFLGQDAPRLPQLQRPHLDFPGPTPLSALVALLDVRWRLLRHRASGPTQRREHRNSRRRIRAGGSRPRQPQRGTRASILISRSLRRPRSLQKRIALRAPSRRHSQSQQPPERDQLRERILPHRNQCAAHFLSPPPLRFLNDLAPSITAGRSTSACGAG